ncbi:MAG: hypothetical protein MZV64_36025 [Ignavibacteriales bacterium]|nr:hypothetical protein [Ignavibacteriales bacterium]
MKAVYNGEVDFSTSFYTPPLNPKDQPAWKEGDAVDIPDDVIPTCKPSDDGKKLLCERLAYWMPVPIFELRPPM